QLYGQRLYKLRVLELNASDERGISIVRLKIKNFARLTVSNATTDDLRDYPCPPYKIIILDEADSMTNDAQAALRRTMENYSLVTRFCLICNYITRIIDPLTLRCLKFRFRSLGNANALARLLLIALLEHVRLDLDDVLNEILAVSNGDLRKAITYLQSAARLGASLLTNRAVSSSLVREIAGVVEQPLLDALWGAICSKSPQEIMAVVNRIVLEGWSAQQVSDQLHNMLIMDDQLLLQKKNAIATLLFETDMRLNSGSDEHIQLLNLLLQVSAVV
ncbi:P-loop containing nucleoside triphosphate hydrolase protein, partial [Metschnikowia bicuspidata]